ncbi:hypothetical protein [Aliikangiella sp. G2MR2-5]|uniref:hypothetical protein n=1 Tax=Aliikangiella sp. G2MR2-5 TaxID=2788943 RepID=UPI0018A99EAA|nr:hypothetical protein [Aliikangiella sp. G2MR2-5]
MKLALKIMLLFSSMITSFCFAESSLSGYLGFSSKYIDRGVIIKTGSANLGLDWQINNWSTELWVADLGTGLEQEVSGSYSFDINSDGFLSLRYGYTTYTNEYDQPYEEFSVFTGTGKFFIELTQGYWQGDNAQEDEYSFYSINYTPGNFLLSYGVFGNEYEGDYLEVGYNFVFQTFDLNFSVVVSSEELSDDMYFPEDAETKTHLVLSIYKNFDVF